MSRRWSLAVLVVGLLASFPALADWQFQLRTGPDYRVGRPYQVVDPWGRPLMPYWAPGTFGRCRVEWRPGPWGWQEVRRCPPVAGFGYGRSRRPGAFWD